MATLQASSVNGNLTKYGNNIYAGGRLLTFNIAQATQTNQYHRIAKFQPSDASNSSQGSGGYMQNVLLRICANPDGNQSNRGNVALVSISSAHWGGPASVVVLNNFVYGLGLITKVRVSKQNASPYEWWVDIYVTNQISAKTDSFIVEAIEGAITLGFTANVSAGTDTTEVDLSESGFYPSKITNTTLITNLNADYLDGQHGSYYLNAANLTGTISGDRGVTAGSSSVSFVEYNGTTATAGQFDGGSTAPSATTRLNYGGYLYAARLYAPIFYDTDNVNYYLDPAGASVLNGLRFAPSGNNVSGNDAIISIVKPDDADWAIQVSGSREYGIDLNMAATHTYAFRSLKAGTEYFRIGSDYLYHDTSIRAPIFYDTNDTNYYCDPNSISVLAALRAPSIGSSYTNHFQIREANGGNGITTDSYAPSIGFHWGGVVASNITLESSGRISIRNNPGTAYENFIANIVYGSSSVQTPIVYDSNNTSFYLDPASFSLASSLGLGGLTTSTNTGMYDAYVDGTSSYFQNPPFFIRLDSSATGAIHQAPVGLFIFNANGTNNTWTKLSMGSREAAGSGNTVSIAGLAARKTSGTANAWASGEMHFWTKSVDNQITNMIAYPSGYVQSDYSFRAPIFYDSNNTNYYLDPASTSNLAIIKADAGANYPHSFTNSDSGNTHWTNRNDRLLTSNGTNWATDGRDPIMALVTSGNSNATTIANSIGLTLHNESQTNNTFSPAITFSNRSNSGNYNTVYAAIIGKKTGQGVDSNWSAGELHFYTMPVGAYENDVPSLLINSAGNVGIGTTNPATLFQIGTGTPTSATGGLQFGDDTGTRIYRSASNTLTMGGTFIATTFSGALSGNATSSTATNDILPTSWTIGISEEANVKPFLFGTLGDLLAFRTISNLQYWTGSAWQSYTNSGIQQLLTGNIQSTNASVAPTNRKFRFEFTAADAYIGGGILVVHQAWNNGAHQISSMLEYWNGSSWVTVITERSSAGGGGENDYHFYNRGNIHGNWVSYRVTITSADTTNNTSYTGIQLLYDYTRANLPNNFLPFSWDYLRNVTLGARLNAFDMVSKQYIYVRHIEGKNWDTYDTTASGLYLNYASNQPVYIGSATNLALHAGNYSGYSNFSGSVISGYGSFASPGHIIGDAQYGLYVASGNLYYKSASSGIHYWRNIANNADIMSLDNSGSFVTASSITSSGIVRMHNAYTGSNSWINAYFSGNILWDGSNWQNYAYGGNNGWGTMAITGTNGDFYWISDAGTGSSNRSYTTSQFLAKIKMTFTGGGNLGIGTSAPATLLQIGTGTPTAATSGIQFGDDTGARIYRSTSTRINTSGNFTSGGWLQTLNDEIYSSGWAGTLNIYCGNTAQNAWISGIALSPGGNVRIPGGLVNAGLSAQWSVSGGGTATFNGSAILWSQRVIAIPVEKTEFSAQGYIDINCPTSGTVVYYNSSDVTTTVTCTASGIPLGQWEALYYEITPGQTNTSDQTKFRVVAYPNSVWRPSSNWLLLAIRNTDAEVVRWIPGQANIKSGGSYDFSRATEYFYADNYYLNGATSTFIRSNGPFNFLTNAGGAQAGKFANIQVSSTYSGTLPTDGILFGTDSNLYRNSADVLKTDDSLIINSKCSVATSISATYTVDINGSLHYTSASASSDARFKKNIEPINDALIKLNNVRGVKFEWNEFVNARRNGYELNKPTLGVIAQELEAVFPELVDHWHLSDDCPDARAVNYEKIIPVLIEAVKELNNKNIQLEARLSALESKLQ